MTLPLFIVDAFTDRAFNGNPAGVVVLPGPADPGWMQSVAAELRHSETAFTYADGNGAWALRWFTPASEVDLCGHATLATAHVLWSDARADPAAAVAFETASGRLAARRRDGLVELDFPAQPATPEPAPPGLLESVGVEPAAVASNGTDWLLELADEPSVIAVAPDFGRLAEVDARGVMVTAVSQRRGVDFVSRWFGPAVGVDEDPVTGSAHCALGPWWAARLGREQLVGYQASPRGGTVRVRVAGDRVLLAGSAVTVVTGQLLAPV
ncbi:MAG: PhzF family phenazine biosynthesis protein [Actinomycetota bacterium]|jgi:PhzF family phenazine biosynthesis protein|nr:PhzF family phenazine biosynthesis protein [Actinomycetota bacterium]